MNQLVSSTKKRYFVFTSALIILLFFMVFLPMVEQLKEQAKENYSILVESKKQTITELINSCLSSAMSVSSRTAIRDYIVGYNDGDITWSALRQQSFAKYCDGVKIISNLQLAIRYVGEETLLTYNPNGIDVNRYINLFNHSTELQYRFYTDQSGTKIAVCSPIIYQGKALGHDIIVVDITEQIREMAKDGFNARILQVNDPLFKHMAPNTIYEEYPIDHVNHMCVIRPINEHYSLFVSKPTSEVYESGQRVSMYSIIGFSLGLMLIFFVINIGLVKLANTMIQEIGFSRDTYMQYAHYDFLTGAYTRVFFDNWIKDKDELLKDHKYVVAMIDVDNFKNINDTFGHKTGDDLLKYIVITLIDSIRQHDMVIRFGGDEFIIVFQGISEEKVLRVFERINQNINDNNHFGFKIFISFGVEEVENLGSIYDSIKRADEKMYFHKRSKLISALPQDEPWE